MGALYGETMRASSVFSPPTASSPSTKGDERWEELHKRVTEHVRIDVSSIPLFELELRLFEIASLPHSPSSPLHPPSSYPTSFQTQNIRVIALYYTRITLARLSELLDLPSAQTEAVLSKLVVEGTIYARIDRPAGVVDFKKKKASEEVLNDWSGRLGEMLGLIEKTSHLINKVSPVRFDEWRGTDTGADRRTRLPFVLSGVRCACC